MTEWLSLLVQPATVLGVGLLVLAILVFRCRCATIVRWLILVLVTVYFSVATPIGANALVGLLERGAVPTDDCATPSDNSVFVVLAGGISGQPRDERDFARLKLGSLRRVLGAVQLAQRFPGSRLVMSGGAGGDVREADLMASLAVAMGVAPVRIRLDRDSLSTYESAVNTAKLLGRTSGTSIFLVSSAMHMRRALATFRSSGLHACPRAVDWQLIHPAPHEAFIPQLSALVKGSAAMHEALGYLAYRLQGRI